MDGGTSEILDAATNRTVFAVSGMSRNIHMLKLNNVIMELSMLSLKGNCQGKK